jgi:hypothetical protein
MSLNVLRRSGTVIVNLSTLPASDLSAARGVAAETLRAGLGMGVYGAEAGPGGDLAGWTVPEGRAALATVCSITLNGALYAAGVPVASRFGGLLEVRDGEPLRFLHIIQYAGTTLDPLEIFIKARMTRVLDAVRTGSGVIGASFREAPASALAQVQRIVQQTARAGLSGLVIVGDPNRPLLDIPVGQGRAGLVVAAGLNPLAAVQEAGIPTENQAMARLCDCSRLRPLAEG